MEVRSLNQTYSALHFIKIVDIFWPIQMQIKKVIFNKDLTKS